MQGLSYAVDIVLVIDKTGSMRPVLDSVKANALKFDSDLKSYMEEKGRPITDLRVKVIAFGDIYADGPKWLSQSEFFELPAKGEDFKNFVNTIKAEGGGDAPENALEALAIAMKSNWTSKGDKRRHLVVLSTDTTAHPLEDRKTKPIPPGTNLPESLPNSMSDLYDLWHSAQAIEINARRMVLFAPDLDLWNDMFNDWKVIAHAPTKAGEGMREVEYKEILEEITNSI